MPLALIELIPASGVQLGPFFLGFYGLGFVVAVAVLVLVSRAEARRRGTDPDLVTSAIVIVAAFAVVGARAYHVLHEWDTYAADPLRAVLPPYAGLGLYGGVIGAAMGIWVFLRGRGIPLARALDIVVPGTLLAQAIARWGNFFNQELYGPPTDAPWGIAIDCAHRLPQHPCAAFPFETTGFHPLFLYESVLTLAGALIALGLSRGAAHHLREGDLASFWMIWYGGVRVVLETFREGWNWTVGGIPTAMLIGAALIVAGAVIVLLRHRSDRAGVAVSASLSPPSDGRR